VGPVVETHIKGKTRVSTKTIARSEKGIKKRGRKGDCVNMVFKNCPGFSKNKGDGWEGEQKDAFIGL